MQEENLSAYERSKSILSHFDGIHNDDDHPTTMFRRICLVVEKWNKYHGLSKSILIHFDAIQKWWWPSNYHVSKNMLTRSCREKKQISWLTKEYPHSFWCHTEWWWPHNYHVSKNRLSSREKKQISWLTLHVIDGVDHMGSFRIQGNIYNVCQASACKNKPSIKDFWPKIKEINSKPLWLRKESTLSTLNSNAMHVSVKRAA